jgi:uridine phosphorylase
VLVPGDPDRAARIAASWETSVPLREHREYRSFRGRYRDVELGTVSAGIGGPSMAIVVDELAQVGVRTILRVGSCGAVDPAIPSGDLVISLAAARFEGTGEAYAPLGYPAVSDPAVYRALVEAATELGIPFHTGVTATVGTFYPEQDRPGFGPAVGDLRDRFPYRDFHRLRIVNVEMECATLFAMAGVFGLRAGALCTVYGELESGDPKPEDPGPAIRVANEAARRLAVPRSP